MAVKFKVVKRKVLNGAEKDSVKNYAIAKTSGTSDLNKLCKLICSRSTLSSADVKAVLDSLNWAMDLELSSGNVVQLGEFGNFRMSINSEGTNTPEFYYIPLETTDESLFAYCNNLEFYEDKIYLFDRLGAEKLFIFDKYGKFLNYVGDKGGASYEFYAPKAFAVNSRCLIK